MTITELYQLLFGKNHLKDGDVIDMAEHGRVGGVSTGQGFKFTQSPNYATKITVDGAVTYIAKAPVGSDQAEAVWQAQKVDTSDGTVITWADSGRFTQIATDLTSLTYE
jgi:hypothetical protein